MTTMKLYLISHTDKSGHNTAQKSLAASTEPRARAIFAERYPERVITAIGVKGRDSA